MIHFLVGPYPYLIPLAFMVLAAGFGYLAAIVAREAAHQSSENMGALAWFISAIALVSVLCAMGTYRSVLP